MKVGDEVEYTGNNEAYKDRLFTIEEVKENGWIWSSQFPSAYQTGYPTHAQRNFHNPNRFKISTRQTRNQKLEELGI